MLCDLGILCAIVENFLPKIMVEKRIQGKAIVKDIKWGVIKSPTALLLLAKLKITQRNRYLLFTFKASLSASFYECVVPTMNGKVVGKHTEWKEVKKKNGKGTVWSLLLMSLTCLPCVINLSMQSVIWIFQKV